MSKNWLKQRITLLISVMLIAAMALSLAACGSAEQTGAASTPEASDVSGSQQVEKADAEEIGQGATKFLFIADDGENAKEFIVHTDKKTVGEALVELELIAGDPSDYGLYVKTVNGVTADYDKDKTYWAFYIDGEYAQTGVDATEIKDGATYMFKIEKG